MNIAIIGFLALLALLLLRLPIAFCLALVGGTGFAYVVGLKPALEMAGQILFDSVLSYSFSVVPLFILMGNFASESRLSQELYDFAYAFVGHRRGGLAMATVVACGGFGAVCGSSLATAATMAKVAMPSMRRYGYSEGLATGAIAAGGSLGILIPPSVVMVLYGIITENDIGKLFIAGIIPGLVEILSYLGVISLITHLRPELGPRGDLVSWSNRIRALRSVWGIALLFLVVLGGIYLGVFTPTEAGGIGATGAFVFALSRRTLNMSSILKVLVETGYTTAMVFIVLFGGLMFANFVNVAGMPKALVKLVEQVNLGPLGVLSSILVIYLVLGCVMDTIGMMVLTVPVFYPLMMTLGFDPIWFGIIVVVVMEMALITPPVGLNVFVLKSVLPEIPLGIMFRGIAPFVAADVTRLSLLVAFPALAIYLPSLLK
jgi:C4-dicarboxylate transporter DctM subunit